MVVLITGVAIIVSIFVVGNILRSQAKQDRRELEDKIRFINDQVNGYTDHGRRFPGLKDKVYKNTGVLSEVVDYVYSEDK